MIIIWYDVCQICIKILRRKVLNLERSLIIYKCKNLHFDLSQVWRVWVWGYNEGDGGL